MNDPNKPPDKPKQAECCVCHQPFKPYTTALGHKESKVCWNCDWALVTYLESIEDE